MEKADVIKLITENYVQDANGIWKNNNQSPLRDERGYIIRDENSEDITVSQNWREVYCNVESVSQSEFFEGGRNGLNPAYKFVMFSFDYQGERTLEYNGLRYGIYRTYLKKNGQIELYAERKGGTN